MKAVDVYFSLSFAWVDEKLVWGLPLNHHQWVACLLNIIKAHELRPQLGSS